MLSTNFDLLTVVLGVIGLIIKAAVILNDKNR